MFGATVNTTGQPDQTEQRVDQNSHARPAGQASSEPCDRSWVFRHIGCVLAPNQGNRWSCGRHAGVGGSRETNRYGGPEEFQRGKGIIRRGLYFAE